MIGEISKGLTSIDMIDNKNSQLKSVDIAYCCTVSDASLDAIGETGKGLTSIDMSDKKNMPDVGIASLTGGCSQLEVVNQMT